MFTISHEELGTFTAETEKEVRAAIRKAKKEQGEKKKEREENYTYARQTAMGNGFLILSKLVKGESFPWTYLPAESLSYGAKILESDSGDTVHYFAQGGDTVYRHYSYRLVGVVASAGGWAFLTFLRDVSSGEVSCLALGLRGDQISFIEVPGVKPEMFRQS